MEKRRERENFWLWKNYSLLWNGVKIEMSLLLQVEEIHRTTWCLAATWKHWMRGHHYDEQIYVGQIGVEVKQTILCALERGISKEENQWWIGWSVWPALPLGVMVKPCLGLAGSVLMSVSPVTTKGHIDILGLHWQLRPFVFVLGACLLLAGSYWSVWSQLWPRTVVTSGSMWLARGMSSSVVLLQLVSMLMSMTYVTTVGQKNHACWDLRACWHDTAPYLSLEIRSWTWKAAALEIWPCSS